MDKSIWWALAFMALGAIIANVAWIHAWKMYKSGKREGLGVRKAIQSNEQANEPPYPQSVLINSNSVRRTK